MKKFLTLFSLPVLAMFTSCDKQEVELQTVTQKHENPETVYYAAMQADSMWIYLYMEIRKKTVEMPILKHLQMLMEKPNIQNTITLTTMFYWTFGTKKRGMQVNVWITDFLKKYCLIQSKPDRIIQCII